MEKEEKVIESKTTFVQPNKKPFNNAIYKVNEQVAEAYAEDLRSQKFYEKYNRLIPELAKPETTLEDLGQFEINTIKRDTETLAQLYFGNEINYFEYFAGLINIVNVFSLVRNNFDRNHQTTAVEDTTQVVDN